jgi:signal peptide peptidase SppA
MTNPNPLLAEFMRGPWCMEEKALAAFIGRLENRPASAIQSRSQNSTIGRHPMTVAEDVATIRISGALLKTVPAEIREWFGEEATGYDEIQEDLSAAVANDKVKSIRLLVDSPGGQLSGITEVEAAIKAADQVKPVTAEVEDGAYSAAYWLASQARSITALSPTGGIGSIGTYLTITDLSGLADKLGIKVHLVSSGRHKGVGSPGVRIEKDQLEPFQNFVDQATDMFVGAVARGRGVPEETVRGWADGRFWMASAAKDMGLIDAVRGAGAGASRSAMASNRDQRATFVIDGPLIMQEAAAGGPPSESNKGSPQGEKHMTSKEELAAAETKAKSEQQSADRQRLTDLKAAFPKDLVFAFEQYEKGASVEQAKASYADVLQARNEKLEKDLQEAQAKTAKAQPEPVVPAAAARPAPAQNNGGGQAATAGGDFMVRAKADQAAHQGKCIERLSGRKSECCGIVAAQSRTDKAFPGLHAEYIEAQRGRAAEVHARKVALGMTGPFQRV